MPVIAKDYYFSSTLQGRKAEWRPLLRLKILSQAAMNVGAYSVAEMIRLVIVKLLGLYHFAVQSAFP